jgi:hypothetical protein
VVTGSVGPAQAATNTESNVSFNFDGPGTTGRAVLPTTLPAGDCREVGANQGPGLATSSIAFQLDPSLGPNIYKVYWSYDLYTTHTSSSDQWHAWFTFKTSPSDQGFQLHFDGPDMAEDSYYVHTANASVSMTPDQFHNLHYVDFGGDC